jgi:hypothetical protein
MSAMSRQAPRSVELLARVGFAAKGIVYLLIGLVTANAAIGARNERVVDSKGAFASVLALPFGQFVLAAMAIGLFGYAAWRILAAISDTEGHGTSWKGIALRIGNFGKAAIHIGLGFAAARLVNGATKAGAGSDASARDWTATFLDAPFGQTLVVIGGVGLVVFAGVQLHRAWTGRFLKPLSPPPRVHPWVARAGRAGITARAVVFAVIGAFVVRAAITHDPGQARGVGGAMRALEAQPYGWALLAAVALGLAAYGAFELAEARYRRIHAT